MSPAIACPVVRVPHVVPCEGAELDGLVAFLESDAGVEEVRAFARGTVLPDGRLDLCKQSVGPQGCARIVSALGRNSHIKSVLLGTDAIGDEGAFSVARLIEANSQLEVVYLGCNGITERGTGELARVLKDNASVKGLWLKRNPLGDGGVNALADMLRHNRSLQVLDIVNCGATTEGFKALCDAVGEHNRTLKRLYVGGNGGLPALPLDEVIRHNMMLEGLFLNVGALGDGGTSVLSLGMRHNRGLRELGVGSNGIGRAGLEKLCASISIHPTLEVLDMGRAASQTVLGAQGNDFSGGGASIGAMLRANGTLRRLNLRGTKLGRDDLEPIFEAAAQHPTLSELLVDAPLRAEVKANLAANRAAHPVLKESGVELIKSVYRTTKTKSENANS